MHRLRLFSVYRPATSWFVLVSAVLLAMSLAPLVGGVSMALAQLVLDATFGTSGKVTTDFGQGNDQVIALAIQPDGKVVAAGGDGVFKLARYNADGSLDSTFASGGKLQDTFGGSREIAFGVVIQSSGRIVAAGMGGGNEYSASSDFALAGYTPNGALDATFGAGGHVRTDFGGTDDARALTRQPDGKLIVAGMGGRTECVCGEPSAGGHFAIARYAEDGTLDASFDNDGKVLTAYGQRDDAYAVVVQPDGKIVAAGRTITGNAADVLLVRYNANGSLDLTFGPGGKVVTDFGGADGASSVVVQPDGKIVAAGASQAGPCCADAAPIVMILARYHPDGTLDTTFGSNGKVVTDYYPGGRAGIHDLIVRPGNKLLAAGAAQPNPNDESGSDMTLAEYEPDGTLNPGFGTGGKLTIPFRSSAADMALSILPLADGKVLLGGYVRQSLTDYDMALVRLGEPARAPTIDSVVNSGSTTEGATATISVSASDPDNAAGSLRYAFDCNNDGVYEIGPQAASTAACSFADNGSYQVNVRVSDPAGGSATGSTMVQVLNVTPTIGPITGPTAPVAAGQPVQLSGAFSDPGTLDTHTATWAWADSTSSAGTVSEVLGSGTASGVHTYTQAGVYTVTLTVTDKDGGQDQESFAYVVVYDPSAGFVTGGGWFDSPAGACRLTTPCEGAVGRASFGFVSRYQPGATVPTGQTQFEFRAGGLRFHSTSYQWLVVAGARAQYKGEGTINGEGRYGFLLTAIDGQVNGGGGTDKLRIKIWDLSRSSDGSAGVVYDNQTGAGDGADPATAIGGGSIVIHR